MPVIRRKQLALVDLDVARRGQLGQAGHDQAADAQGIPSDETGLADGAKIQKLPLKFGHARTNTLRVEPRQNLRVKGLLRKKHRQMVGDVVEQGRNQRLNRFRAHAGEKAAFSHARFRQLGATDQPIRIGDAHPQIDGHLALQGMVLEHISRIGENSFLLGQKMGDIRVDPDPQEACPHKDENGKHRHSEKGPVKPKGFHLQGL
ncbi:hypothetical protein DESC_180078 [Desulfosarcina cetonica]|nr:hypothetical protein DESC_180078 [Desulfosarcina cetonica]